MLSIALLIASASLLAAIIETHFIAKKAQRPKANKDGFRAWIAETTHAASDINLYEPGLNERKPRESQRH